MKLVQCKDGSYTYYNEEVKEWYHSLTGALKEANEKYCNPIDFKKLVKKGTIKILDVCFGLGYNSAAAIQRVREISKECVIEVTALEKDPKIIVNMQHIQFPFKQTYMLDLTKQTGNTRQVNKDNTKITLLIGDARRTIKKVHETFDIIFFDPFSPSRVPHMWSAQFLENVYDKIKKDGIFITYSCARRVRDNLKKAGFQVFDGPKIERRGPSTHARHKEYENPY